MLVVVVGGGELCRCALRLRHSSSPPIFLGMRLRSSHVVRTDFAPARGIFPNAHRHDSAPPPTARKITTSIEQSLSRVKSRISGKILPGFQSSWQSDKGGGGEGGWGRKKDQPWLPPRRIIAGLDEEEEVPRASNCTSVAGNQEREDPHQKNGHPLQELIHVL